MFLFMLLGLSASLGFSHWLLLLTLVPFLFVALFMYATLKVRNRPIYILLAASAVALLLGAYWSYPSRASLAQKQDLLFSRSPKDVKSILIEPAYDRNDPRHVVNLVNGRVVINESDSIAEIMEAIHTARTWHPSRSGEAWTCLVTIIAEDDAVTINVADRGTRNGVMIIVSSNGNSGWVLGTFRCDEVGPAITAAVEKLE